MGVALIVVPSTVAVLLLGDGLTGTGLTVPASPASRCSLWQ